MHHLPYPLPRTGLHPTPQQTDPEASSDSGKTLFSQLEDLDFADDLALLSTNQYDMQDKTDGLNNFARQVVLSINKSKTQVMCVNSVPTEPILVNDEPLEFVEDFTYLGSLISKDSGASKDIKTRLGKAQGAFSPNSGLSGDQNNTALNGRCSYITAT